MYGQPNQWGQPGQAQSNGQNTQQQFNPFGPAGGGMGQPYQTAPTGDTRRDSVPLEKLDAFVTLGFKPNMASPGPAPAVPYANVPLGQIPTKAPAPVDPFGGGMQQQQQQQQQQGMGGGYNMGGGSMFATSQPMMGRMPGQQPNMGPQFNSMMPLPPHPFQTAPGLPMMMPPRPQQQQPVMQTMGGGMMQPQGGMVSMQQGGMGMGGPNMNTLQSQMGGLSMQQQRPGLPSQAQAANPFLQHRDSFTTPAGSLAWSSQDYEIITLHCSALDLFFVACGDASLLSVISPVKYALPAQTHYLVALIQMVMME